MNGNLSLKKGLISELTDKELTAIAEMLYVWAGFNEVDVTKKEDSENRLNKERFIESCQALTDEELDRLYVSALMIKDIAARLDVAESKADYALSEKADKTETFTIAEMEEKLLKKADKTDTYTKVEVDAGLSEKEDVGNKITIDEWNAVGRYDRPSQLYNDDRYLSARVAYALHEGIMIDTERHSYKILGTYEFETKDAPYYSAKATDERIETAIKSAILDSWEAAV